MARRSSARLRDRASTTPKRVSLSHDAHPKTPRTAPVRLTALHESDEIPGAFPQSASPPQTEQLSKTDNNMPVKSVKFTASSTPKKTSPIEPSDAEMHPQLHHQSTAKPLEEARWLGFSKMAAPHTEPVKRGGSKIATLQDTPSRSMKQNNGQAQTPPQFKFTFRREQSLELSPEAKKLMLEKREEAAKIREQMIASGGGEKDDIDMAIERKIAMPKGKKGRFSQAHMDQFKKMDSIAGHASAFRADPNRGKVAAAGAAEKKVGEQSPIKSLKRKTSKAQLDEPENSSSQSPSKVRFGFTGLTPGRTGPAAAAKQEGEPDESSPSKRMKRAEGDDAGAARASNSSKISDTPSTPQTNKTIHRVMPPSVMASLASPTAASLARASSVKSVKTSKIPAPALAQSPSKSNLNKPETAAIPQADDGLLSRSPSKHIPSIKPATLEPTIAPKSPFLLRSPARAPPSKLRQEATAGAQGEQAQQHDAPLLSRSPVKMPATKSSASTEEQKGGVAHSPLLSRSPVKNPGLQPSKPTECSSENANTATSIPLLSRSPAKITIPDPFVESDNKKAGEEGTPSKTPGGSSLFNRFNLLRASPVKSILRSPQRLYSNDPAKIAAGTHLATPPKVPAHLKSKSNTPLQATATTPSQKRVDFSSSTKARYERAQSDEETGSSTPSKHATPLEKKSEAEQASLYSQPLLAGYPLLTNYPSLPTEEEQQSTTPTSQKKARRQTATPADFTFRAGTQEIIFSPSPRKSTGGRPINSEQVGNTIRHVSAQPPPAHSSIFSPAPPPSAQGSKKRKFEFENERAVDQAHPELESKDKENLFKADDDVAKADGERPAKRAKPSSTSSSSYAMPTATSTGKAGSKKVGNRLPSSGSRAKGAARNGGGKGKAQQTGMSTISLSRLNALAAPKKR